MAATEGAAAAAAPAAATGYIVSDIPPNQTLYLNNLNEKLKKDALKKALFAVFSQFGRILDIVALRTLRMRGQAWVVFADVASATAALRQMQNFPFYGKAMRIQFCKTKSDAAARRDGTFVPRNKRKRIAEAEAAAGMKRQATGKGVTAAAAPVMIPAPARQTRSQSPNNILFAEDLPPEANQDMLKALFEQYAGFKEVRLVAGKGVAFIEFETITQSTSALQGLINFKLSHTHTLHLSYAKK